MTEFFPFDSAPTPQMFGSVNSVIWNGRHFVASTSTNASCDLTAAVFDDRGALIAGDIAIASTPACESGAAMLALLDGRTVVAYTRGDRVVYRLFTD
jgi:hypothetical protein